MKVSVLLFFIISLLLGVTSAANEDDEPGRTGNLTNALYNGLGVSTTDRHVINATQAQAVINACAAQAVNQSVPYYNIAVVDPGAYLVAFLRQDSAFPASIELSIVRHQNLQHVYRADMSTEES